MSLSPATRGVLAALAVSVVSVVSVAGEAAPPAAGITVAWDPNPEPNIVGYIVYVGEAPNQYQQIFDVGSRTSFTFAGALAGRRYHFAVSAYADGRIEGPLSNEVSADGLAIGGGGGGGGGGGAVSSPSLSTESVSPPTSNNAPAGPGVVLQPALVSGMSLTLQWAAVGGLPVLEYIIEAGSAPGLSNIYNGSVGMANRVDATVGPGIYYVRIRARAESASTVTSNEISFSAGISACTAPPPTPAGVSASVSGGTASASWQPVANATSYLIAAGSAAGLSDVYYGNVGNSVAVAAPVWPGFTAYVRVVAVNACGQSAASSDVFIQ